MFHFSKYQVLSLLILNKITKLVEQTQDTEVIEKWEQVFNYTSNDDANIINEIVKFEELFNLQGNKNPKARINTLLPIIQEITEET